MMPATLAEIRETEIDVRDGAGRVHTLPNDVVFSMIGREPPLDFLRRSGVSLRGESSGRRTLWTLLLILAMAAVCDWKSEGFISRQLSALGRADAFPRNMPAVLSGLGEWWSAQLAERRTLLGTLAVSMTSRSFYFTLLYTIVLAVFGWKRIRRRRTPYVTVQTITLFLVQLFPLFLLPELILPWLGYNEVFSTGPGQAIADSLFERTVPEADDVAGRWPEFGHPRAYWRAYGLILAWPLMVHNIFTPRPMWAWIAIGVLQTFVVIPWMIRRWGKGAYCGWICSCGGLAETAGDTLRERMPHGPRWNRLNMAGQAILAAAFLLLAVRIAGWLVPGTWMDGVFYFLFEGTGAGGRLLNPLSWKWTVDVLLASILGVGLYLSYSGRVWCRFFCPLAALMHVYARFSRFRIAADKKKCISCNVCTAVCHQGIDVMSFANKGLPMADPQCVRCSACVHSCPTAVLEFVQINTRNGQVVRREKLAASPVRMKESVLSTEH
jgi:polyferredoxin